MKVTPCFGHSTSCGTPLPARSRPSPRGHAWGCGAEQPTDLFNRWGLRNGYRHGWGAGREGGPALRETSHGETPLGSSDATRSVFPIPLASVWRRRAHGRPWFYWKGQSVRTDLFPWQPRKIPDSLRVTLKFTPGTPSLSPSPPAPPRRRSTANLTAAAGPGAARSLNGTPVRGGGTSIRLWDEERAPSGSRVLPPRRCPAAPPPDPACRLPTRGHPVPGRCPREGHRGRPEGTPPARHPPVGHLLPEGEAPQLLLQGLVCRRQPRLLGDPGGTRRLPTALGPPAAAATRRPRLLPAGRGGGVHCGGAVEPTRKRRSGTRGGQAGGGRRLQALGWGGGGDRGAAAGGAAGRAASRGGCKWQRGRAASIGGRTAAGHCGKLPAAHARSPPPLPATRPSANPPIAAPHPPPRPHPTPPPPRPAAPRPPPRRQGGPPGRGSRGWFWSPPRPAPSCSVAVKMPSRAAQAPRSTPRCSRASDSPALVYPLAASAWFGGFLLGFFSPGNLNLVRSESKHPAPKRYLWMRTSP